jgi:prolipoprotein diacylglyceryl transferase
MYPSSRWLGRRYLLRIGGWSLPSYVALLYVGCLIGVFAGAAVGSAAGLDATKVALATIILLIPALIGARVLFVLQNWSLFRHDRRRIWRRSDGGMGLYGGLFVIIPLSIPLLAALDLSFWSYWDAATVTMLVGLVFTRFGCLMNGCCYGRVTTGRVGMWLPDHTGVWQRRFPTQLVEAGWGVVVLVIALLARGELPFDGALFAAAVAAYASVRIVLEPTRQDSARLHAANIALSAVLFLSAAAVLATGVWV